MRKTLNPLNVLWICAVFCREPVIRNTRQNYAGLVRRKAASAAKEHRYFHSFVRRNWTDLLCFWQRPPFATS